MSTHTLYRFFDADNQLLYVGLTINPGPRMQRHRATKPWWGDIARIEMQQLPDLESLRVAERDAIAREKPLYNVRLNGSDPTPALDSDQPPVVVAGLVGRWFHSWRPATPTDSEHATRRGDRILEWQGRVLDRIEDGLYLIETFSWRDGTSTGQQLITADAMTIWTFYNTNIEMVAALGCRESWRAKGALCGNPAEYVSDIIGLAALCGHCAGYYGTVRPIIWHRDGAKLGPETRVPHPLSQR